MGLMISSVLSSRMFRKLTRDIVEIEGQKLSRKRYVSKRLDDAMH